MWIAERKTIWLWDPFWRFNVPSDFGIDGWPHLIALNHFFYGVLWLYFGLLSSSGASCHSYSRTDDPCVGYHIRLRRHENRWCRLLRMQTPLQWINFSYAESATFQTRARQTGALRTGVRSIVHSYTWLIVDMAGPGGVRRKSGNADGQLLCGGSNRSQSVAYCRLSRPEMRWIEKCVMLHAVSGTR